MSTKLSAIESAPDRGDTLPRRRSATTAVRDRRSASPQSPGILDAVCDQHGEPWIRYGTQGRAIWFAVGDLVYDATRVFRALAMVGTRCLTGTSQNELKRAVEGHATYREALVARRQGWLEGFYVFGDGSIARPASDRREVIITFDLNPKFTPSGTRKDWVTAVAPFVAGQPVPFLAISLALAGPLLRFAPPDYLNPQVELVGRGETGKTSVGALAASVWAGDPSSTCGGGESWDLTLNAVDDLKLLHRDGFAFVDEGNLAGATLRERREFARQAVFKIATTGGKRRFGDPVGGEQAHVALFSTTNTSLADLVEGTGDVGDAVQSRMVTIRIGAPALPGVFHTVPAGYSDGRSAVEALRASVDRCWGAAGRKFIARLVSEVERDEVGFRNDLARRLEHDRRALASTLGSARAGKTFALAGVAGHLAQKWGVLPKAWGHPRRIVRTVAKATLATPHGDQDMPLAAVEAYLARHRSALISIADLAQPLSRVDFQAAVGFLHERDGMSEVMIPAHRFQSDFLDYQTLMNRLRKAGLARTETGRHPKLTIKVPRAICAAGRVYCIRLSPQATSA